MIRLPTNARWFDRLGTYVCGKPSVGKLMNERNDSLGSYCSKCAHKAIKLSKDEDQ